MKMGFGDGHPDSGGKALAQRSGGGFDAKRMIDLRMPGRRRTPLPVVLDVVNRDGETGEMEHRIQQHRRMPCRKHEPIAILPGWILRIHAQESAPQHNSEICHPHRRSGMTGISSLDGVDGKRPHSVNSKLRDVLVHDSSKQQWVDASVAGQQIGRLLEASTCYRTTITSRNDVFNLSTPVSVHTTMSSMRTPNSPGR